VKIRESPAYPYVSSFILVVLISVLIVEVSGLRPDKKWGTFGTYDYIEYWASGQLLIRGENPYDLEELFEVEVQQDWPCPEPLVMWNPPWLLVWISPILFLDFPSSAFVWVAINITLLLVASSLLWSAYNPGPLGWKVVIAWIAGASFGPAMGSLVLGQCGELLLIGLSGFLFFVQRGNPLVAGAFLALSSIKPHLVYLLWVVVAWWIVRERKWTLVIGGLLVMLPSFGLLFWMRPQWMYDYYAAWRVPPAQWATPTFGGLLRWILGIEHIAPQYLLPVVAIVVVIICLMRSNRTVDWRLHTGPILLVSVATAAYGWIHDQTVLLIPYLQVVSWIMKEGMYSIRDRIAIVCGLLAYNLIVFVQYQMSVNEFHKFWDIWILLGTCLFAWRARQIKDPQINAADTEFGVR
jgi:hypothetical protein